MKFLYWLADILPRGLLIRGMMIGALLLLYGVITTAPVLPVFKLPATATAYTETALDKKKLFKVIKVVDGDTVEASIRGKTEPIRLLGIDTPETVDPRRPVQCFGKAASDKMKSLVSEQFVKLVDDRTQGNKINIKGSCDMSTYRMVHL